MGYIGVAWNLDTRDWELASTDPQTMLSSFQGNFTMLGNRGILELQHDVINASVDLFPAVPYHHAPVILYSLTVAHIHCTALSGVLILEYQAQVPRR